MTRGAKRGVVAVAGAATLALVMAKPPSATTEAGVRAELDGRQIGLIEVGRHHCHDARWPVIRCFDSEAEAQRDRSEIE